MKWKEVKKGCVEKLNRGDLTLNSKQIWWILKEMREAYHAGYYEGLNQAELKLKAMPRKGYTQ